MFTFLTAVYSLNSFSCDQFLEAHPRDCDIQDQYQTLKNSFKSEHNIQIENIKGYLAPRFIDRISWQTAVNNKTPLNLIYKPAPDTWNTWNNGIQNLFNSKYDFKDILFDNEYLTGYINLHYFSQLDQQLIASNISDSNSPPGKIRSQGDKDVGYCETTYSREQLDDRIDYMNQEIDLLIKNWETRTGLNLKKLAYQEGISELEIKKIIEHRNNNQRSNDSILNLHSSLDIDSQYPDYCPQKHALTKDQTYFVWYSTSYEVETRLKILIAFIKANIILYKQNKSALSPIKLITIAQKYFVTTHPFGDGNGRTSRALQDLLSLNFNLPFIIGADLQNDVTSTYDQYMRDSYDNMEQTISFLHDCLREYQKKKLNVNTKISWQCQTENFE